MQIIYLFITLIMKLKFEKKKKKQIMHPKFHSWFSQEISQRWSHSLCPTNVLFLTCFDRKIYSLQTNKKERGKWGVVHTPCMRFPSSHNDNPPAAIKLLLFPESILSFFSFLDALARRVYEREWETLVVGVNMIQTKGSLLIKILCMYAYKPKHI